MVKKKDKKDKESKKARMAEKQAKANAKSETKLKKKSKKMGDVDEEEIGIDEILANYAKEQEQFEQVTIKVCGRPSKRLNPTMVPNSIQGKRELLLFGGETTTSAGLSIFYNELYSYSIDSDQWRLISSPNSPLPRSGHAMCCHPSGLVLVFGGEFSSPKQTTFYHYGDTWTLDPHTKEWAKVESKKSPSARSGHRMTTWKNYILLHGGFRDLSTSTTYLDDLWAFDVTSYKWYQIEMPPNHMIPEPRSGHSFVPCQDGAVLWGGYSKVKAGKGQQRGKVHSDSWLLKMKSDLSGIRWERRKKSGYAPSPRVGCSMVHHRGRGILFGGVYDTDETEESLDSIFYNSLFAYQIEQNKWFALTLRPPRKRQVERIAVASKQESRQADLEATLKQLLKDSGKLSLTDSDVEDNKGEDESTRDTTPSQMSDDDEPLQLKEYPIVPNLPHPRFNATSAVIDDTLFIFGGVWENGDQEHSLDSMYSIDLGKLDGLKVYWEDLRLDEEVEESDDEEDGEEEYDEESDEDEDMDDYKTDQTGDDVPTPEVEEPEDPEIEGIPDPRPWLPHPKPFEVLRAFYQRTAREFLDWALKTDNEARGKELKKLAFDLCEDRWWERREELRATEDQYDEMGGVADVVEKDPAVRKARR
jgi:Domain of unknown function (DUF4110)/Galactose oxidase, central domain